MLWLSRRGRYIFLVSRHDLLSSFKQEGLLARARDARIEGTLTFSRQSNFTSYRHFSFTGGLDMHRFPKGPLV